MTRPTLTILAGMLIAAIGCVRQTLIDRRTYRPRTGEDLLPERIGDDIVRTKLIDAPTRPKVEELINGESGLYYAYDLVKLTRGLYGKSREKNKIIVDVYTMPSVNDAFGVYTIWRQGAPEPEDAFEIHPGIQAIGNESGVNFRMGKYFVRVFSKSDPDGVDQAAGHIAALEHVEGGGEFVQPEPDLPHLSLLPKEGRVDNSIVYVKRNFRGFAQLRHAVAAEYKSATSDGFEFFICRYESPHAAADAIESLNKSITGLGVKTSFSGGELAYNDEFNGDVTMILAGRHVVAATGGRSALAERIAAEIGR